MTQKFAYIPVLLNSEKDNKKEEGENRINRKHANFIIAHNRKLIDTV